MAPTRGSSPRGQRCRGFAKLKAMLRKTQARTVDALWSVIGQLLDRFDSAECERYVRHCGYCRSG
jgi:hypothetical protein